MTIDSILYMALAITVVVLVVLVIVAISIFIKSRKKDTKKEIIHDKNSKVNSNVNTATVGYNTQSIMKFMEFDEIMDNMIIQNNGKRFLMIIECQGVNYDLMSGMEKTAVEEGFLQFLNTLREPIQIYIQTRTINLENSISSYKDRVGEIERELKVKEAEFIQNQNSGLFTEKELQRDYYELTKLRNLCEYGKDVVYNTEMMSLNKNVLKKQYYIVIPYYIEEESKSTFAKEEIQGMAFSDLYTKAQTIIYAISSTGVTAKILNSKELAELLYMAYNRDDAEIYGIDKALKADYDSLYSTAPYVLDKKIAELDKEIRENAEDMAEAAIKSVRSKREKKLQERIESKQTLIQDFAKSLLEENATYIGEDMAEAAIDEIDKTSKESKTKEESADEKLKAKSKKRIG